MQDEPTVNPTVLARELGILKTKPGEGDGRLISWEKFWELVGKTYWERRVERTSLASSSDLTAKKVS